MKIGTGLAGAVGGLLCSESAHFRFRSLDPVKRGALRGLRNRYRLRGREAVRDLLTAFALLTSFKMTEEDARSAPPARPLLARWMSGSQPAVYGAFISAYPPWPLVTEPRQIEAVGLGLHRALGVGSHDEGRHRIQLMAGTHSADESSTSSEKNNSCRTVLEPHR